jgi:hypothetical protein
MSKSRWLFAPAVACAAFVLPFGVGCTPTPEEEPPVEFGEELGLPACDSETVSAHPDSRCFTYRGVAGVSMGGGTAARLGFSYPGLFDVVGMMGTPFADMEALWGMILGNQLTGFCSLDQLEAVMADDPARLNDPTDPEVWCGVHDVWPLADDGKAATRDLPAVPGSECYMFKSDFNHWYRGPDEGRGGGFGRNDLIEIFHDIVSAWGNPLTYNPESSYFPPGVPDSWHVAPQVSTDEDRAAVCANPVVMQGVYNREYNPDGSYDVITFCDGAEGRNGDYDPTSPSRERNVIEFALAVDLNGNGKRDYAEPLVINNRERWADVGVDGLADEDEPGYDAETNPDPAGDNWDPNTNPDGGEKNWKWDEGEAFDDDGLDGVPATGDYGEDNGDYDLSPTLEKLFSFSPGALFNAIGDEQVARMDLWIDAGIRDFLNTAQISNAFFSQIKKRVPDAEVYNDFRELPGVDDQPYIYYLPDYSRSAMGQAAYLRYGDSSICPSTDDILGDGNHVGPAIIHRLYTLIGFMSARQPAQGRDQSIGGDVIDLESPNGRISDFGFLSNFQSDALSRDVDYGVLLPPDYFLSDRQEQEYPVLYFFHGQGQNAADMVGIGLVLWGSMKESARDDRIEQGLTDFQRSIIIFVDGECLDDTCWTGNFYADFEGLPRDDRRFETAFIELMDHVESNYRVKKPELVPLSALK